MEWPLSAPTRAAHPRRRRSLARAGTIDVGEPLARSSAFVQIDAASFRTGNKQRDDQVRSERLLDTDRNEFGVTAYRGMAGRYLDMTIEARCVRT
jgi:YceI-like domain